MSSSPAPIPSTPWKTTAWGSPGPSTEPIGEVSLTDIMSEELAANLQEKEEKAELKRTIAEVRAAEGLPFDEEEPFFVPEADTSNDLVLAQYLQHEFDKERDTELQLREAKMNGNEKVRISFDNYRSIHPAEESDDSSDDDDDYREYMNQKIDVKKGPDFGPSGLVKKHDGTFISKHDKVISGRKNTAKVLQQFPPSFQTGDAAGIDLQLSNKVYNSLKRHSHAEAGRLARLHEKKEKSTAEHSMDANTRLILFKMVNGGLLEGVNGAISTGKEAIVFHAVGGEEQENGKVVPEECALKVFKTTLTEFKNRCEYVKDDYRFKNPRKVLKIWAEKEMYNLNRMRRAGIRCPEVVKLRKHVLVMSFVGAEGKPAPKLKDVKLEEEELATAFKEILKEMQTMYSECKLVHADLSEFNILYWDGHCWIIDVSQAVDTSHPKSLVFLARDCMNISRFFGQRGLSDVPSPREIFNMITGLDIQSEEKFLTEVQDYQLENRAVQLRKDKQNPADCDLRKHQEEERKELEEKALKALLERLQNDD